MTRKLWAICLAVWFIVFGLLTLTDVRFDGQNIIMGVLAIAVGILVILDK